MRRRLIITTALAAIATLAMGSVGPLGATAKSKRVAQLSCAFELYAQGPPQGVPPSANSFGLVSCPRAFGNGLHYGSATATSTGDGQGTVAVRFKKYFDRGTISGTVAGTPQTDRNLRWPTSTGSTRTHRDCSWRSSSQAR